MLLINCEMRPAAALAPWKCSGMKTTWLLTSFERYRVSRLSPWHVTRPEASITDGTGSKPVCDQISSPIWRHCSDRLAFLQRATTFSSFPRQPSGKSGNGPVSMRHSYSCLRAQSTCDATFTCLVRLCFLLKAKRVLYITPAFYVSKKTSLPVGEDAGSW